MARRAAQSVLRFGSVNLLFDWTIKPAVEKHGVIVTAGAPLRRLRADDILHVLDGFSVPLVVERSEMMRRAVELIVDVFVTPGAFLAGHEECRGYRASYVGFSR